jgi:NTE family protein
VAVALGSGAARGYAHFGVLKVLEEQGLVPDLIVGTSMGALVGASVVASGGTEMALRRFRAALADPYLMGGDLAALRDRSESGAWEVTLGLVRRGMSLMQGVLGESVVPREAYARILRALLPWQDIELMSPPFACVSTNLTRGTRQLWREGPLVQAVSASCAIPGVFPAADIDGEMHVDGGWVEGVPVLAARELGADCVIAVEIADAAGGEPERGVDVLLEANRQTRRALTSMQMMAADIVLRPAVADVHWADFHRLDDLVEIGRRTALENLESLNAAWAAAPCDDQKGRNVWKSWIDARRVFAS